MKKIWIFFVFMLLALMIFSACSTSTKGRSPADGEWDHVQFWNGGTLIWENEEGVVKIDSQESKNHSMERGYNTPSQTIKRPFIFLIANR